ncbi:MAG: translation elongation factor Ts [bacterium]|nr:translation elongation factor Ts [bacterium]
MEVTTDRIKELRDRTGVSVMQCKKALESSGGDFEAAIQFLREHANVSAGKKADRTLAAGAVANYTHDGVIGAMVLLACETDFVAKNPEFATLARDIAMQVAAMDPGSQEELLAEPFIKDGSRAVHDLLDEAVQKFGERIEISSYARLAVR